MFQTKECAYYDYEEQEKAALHFKAPVVNASFAAIVVKSPVELVKVSVECPKTNVSLPFTH